MRWLVTGAHGMLGTDLVDLLRSTGEDVTTASRASLDLTARCRCPELRMMRVQQILSHD